LFAKRKKDIIHFEELSSARIWQHKLCATLSASVNINYIFPIKVYYRICTVRHIRIEIIHGSQNVFWVLTWVGGLICIDEKSKMAATRVRKIIIYKFEQTITLQNVLLRHECQSYWWSIRNNNIVFAHFNCSSYFY
jgi:hypothetical protein